MRNRPQLRRKASLSSAPRNRKGLIATAIAAGMALIGFSTVAAISAPPARDENLCIIGQPPGTIVALVVDASGEFTEVQQQAMLDRIARALTYTAAPTTLGRIVTNETRIDVYDATAAVGETLHPVFSKCSPTALHGLQRISGNSRRLEHDYERNFEAPLLATLADLVGHAESDRSPILESLTAASERSFAGRTVADAQKVLLVSDLLQNSEVLSFYRDGVTDFSRFEQSSNFNAVRPDLRGADVCVVSITRANEVENRLQTTRLVRWWEDYIRASRGRTDIFCFGEFQI
ncbi:hypothetical protein [Maricaulis sp.]|uniref:hypothetical protein n=1 Tax=Maricaulis sp. TaxID=1486257 RepID=UPI003A8E095D